jgi:hypothetical protein
VSDIDTAVVDSLKALDPSRPIREAEVAEATLAWAGALGEDDPDKVLPLYAEDAVFWGTLSPTLRADRAALRDYFVTAFKVLPGLKVAFGD